MLLRPRQKEFVFKAIEALKTYRNTLAVAPTGAGKTIMLAAILTTLFKETASKACVIAHRDELTIQNQSKFKRINSDLSTGVYNAAVKNWENDVTFAMVQTLSRKANLETMPKMDVVVIDEAHHARTPSYQSVIDHVKALNPDVMILGVTATPVRGDKLGLHTIFSNVSDQITVRELIASGHLVKPRTFILDVGVRDSLQRVKQTEQDYDMDAVAKIMNTSPINSSVVKQWYEHAHDRKTVVFCSTINHAKSVTAAFIAAGIPTVMVYGEMLGTERFKTLDAYASGNAQVIVNVAVLTEGWDSPPTSCVVLLRPSSHKSTMIQMIGRGLRIIDTNEFPGVIKEDCVVLDFGISLMIHGTLEQTATLKDKTHTISGLPYKDCPECSGTVPMAVKECPLCGYIWEEREQVKPPMANFDMLEIDMLKQSSFLWLDLDDNHYMAAGFNAWAVIMKRNDIWYAIGARNSEYPKLLASATYAVCFASANDWLNLYETEDTAHKTRSWIYQLASQAQLKHLPVEYRHDYNLTRYKASLLMTMKFKAKAITTIINNQTNR